MKPSQGDKPVHNDAKSSGASLAPKPSIVTSVIDIKAKRAGVAGELSNFTRRTFTFRGVPCHSIEGVLQAAKVADVATQLARCLLDGVTAKRAGKVGIDWKLDQTLYWGETRMARKSDAYDAFLKDLFDTVFDQCPEFRKSLADTAGATLMHTIGRTDERETVLTRDEFIRQLDRLRQPLID